MDKTRKDWHNRMMASRFFSGGRFKTLRTGQGGGAQVTDNQRVPAIKVGVFMRPLKKVYK